MRLFRAMRPNVITQLFGQNKLSLYKELGMKGHNGWDWACMNGEPIYWDCSIRGTVLDCHTDRNGGLGIRVITQEVGGAYKHLFWHLKDFNVKAGDILESGDLIGWGNTTGRSTGPHLHRGLKPVYQDKHGNWKNRLPSNGYFGAVDIQPYFTSVFIREYVDQLKRQISILRRIIEMLKKIIKLKVEIQIKS